MPQNLLQIVQTICFELGLNPPSVVVNSTDLQIRQINALVSRSLRELQQNYDWTVLQTEYDLYVAQPTITTGNTIIGSYKVSNIPSTNFIEPGEAPLWTVSGQNIPVATRINTVNSLTEIAVSQPSTASASNISLTFAKDTYSEPSDFSRFINQTWWDRTNRWALMGPDSPQVDQWHRSGIVTIGPRRHFRQIGFNVSLADFNSDFNNDFNSTQVIRNYRIWPAPGATDTPLDLAYEYISENCVISASGVLQPGFLVDSDIPIIDANMLVLDTKWRFWQIKGFDYAPLQMEARDYIERTYANDGGAKTLPLSRGYGNFGWTTGLVQDGNWPGPSTSGI